MHLNKFLNPLTPHMIVPNLCGIIHEDFHYHVNILHFFIIEGSKVRLDYINVSSLANLTH